MAVLTGQVADFISPLYRKIYYESMVGVPEKVWRRLFETVPSKKNKEYTSGMSRLGLPTKKIEGKDITYDAPYQLYDQTITMISYGTGVEITKEAYDDELYNSWEKLPGWMAESMEEGKDVLAAVVFNSGTATTYHTLANGEALFSDTHAMHLGATADNIHTAAALSETALGTAKADFAAMTDHRGRLMNLEPAILLVPAELETRAQKDLKSTQEPETANNAINPQYNSLKLEVWPQLTSATRWFLVCKPNQHTLTWYDRQRPDFEKDYDTKNRNLTFNTMDRFAFAIPDWRGLSTNAGA